MASSQAAERNGIRLCADDWLEALDISLWDEQLRDRIERLQWDLGQDLLRLGNVVVVEWGSWGRDERERLRTRARLLGARVELIFLDPPLDELWRRIQRRGQEDPPISRADLAEWDKIIQRPDEAELADYDSSVVIDG
jgi:predicted kinase